MSTLSANARKQKEEDIERLVKCRLRSEIEARKAVESTMKRAEKEELRLAARKNVVSAAGSGGKEATRGGSAGVNRDNQTGKQGSNKTVELKLRQQIQHLTVRNTDLETNTNELQQQVSDLEAQKAVEVTQLTADLEEKDREITSLRAELKKTKIAVDETKRKCQKMLKEKREEAQRALQENEQLARCTKTLQSQLALLPQLKKQLEHAKEKRADVVEVWQKKLEQRDEAFLREEEVSKQKLAESAAQIDELRDEKDQLQTRLVELERKLCNMNTNHQTELRHEAQRLVLLESTSKELQEKLLEAETATREAEQAEVVARETREQETRLRQLAEDAADAVEVRAEKAERDLEQAQRQLNRLEEVLKARGVTLDYLLKQQTPISVASRASLTARIQTTSSTLKKSHSTRTRGSIANKAVPKLQRSTRINNNEDDRDR
ncbi:hypothetical protein Pcac1_g2763 [Phytophthora cactorum]|nr:hypothetical protein Pcac1_g2763 [Phytophthora cactorum]